MSILSGIRWGWIVLGAILGEAVLFGVAVLLYVLPGGPDLLSYAVPPVSLVAMAAAGFWVARRATHHRVLHGTLVGVIAALAYVGLTWGKALPVAYLISHGLKVIGGMLGGVLAQRRGA
jgi:putative membrane protein (TIGR04086 family)